MNNNKEFRKSYKIIKYYLIKKKAINYYSLFLLKKIFYFKN